MSPSNLVDETGHQAGPWDPLVRLRRIEQAVNETFAAFVTSAPVQFTSGAIDAVSDTLVGMASGARDRLARTVDELRAHPEYLAAGSAGVAQASSVAEGRHQVREVQARAAEQGGGARGWFVAVNQQWNPAYGIFEHGDKAIQAAKKGDWHSTGAETTHTGVAVVGTVALAEGGAAIAEGALARGAGPRPKAPLARPLEPPAPKALPPGPAPRVPTPKAPGPTVDPLTGTPVGQFVVDPKGNTLIQPKGGATVGNPAGTFVETRFPNGSPAQQLHGPHKHYPDPHGHGFQPGAGVNERGPSLDPQGNVVPYDSRAAHWPVNK